MGLEKRADFDTILCSWPYSLLATSVTTFTRGQLSQQC